MLPVLKRFPRFFEFATPFGLGCSILFLLLFSFANVVQAQSMAQVRSWAAACANCHGTNGNAMPGMVSLAGMPSSVLTQKMLDYKNDKAPATVMHQIAKGYDETQIRLIADYFSKQK